MAPVNWENLFTYETLVHALSGAAGSVTAMSVFFPLDTVRSRLQVEDGRAAKNTLAMLKDLVQEEGCETLYRGLGPVLTSICCSNFVYFYTFHGLRSALVPPTSSHNAWRDLSLASVAGIINVMVTTPLWVVNTRLKMQGIAQLRLRQQDRPHPPYTGTLDGLRKIAASEGVATLWNGALPSLLLVSNPAVQFMIYEYLKRRAGSIQKELGSLTIFAIGAVSKSMATLATYPLQILQSKLRYGSAELRKKNLLGMLEFILKTQGFRGLYKGLEAKLLQTVMTAALMFVCYEKIVLFVFHVLKGGKQRSQ